MANPDHMRRLKEGDEAWNAGRPESPDLSGADLSWMDLRNYDLTRANFRDAWLKWTDFTLANLTSADLRGAKLGYANFSLVKLDGADLRGAVLGLTVFAFTSLRGTKLDDIEHAVPSAIGIDMLVNNPHLPPDFLRGCGVPEKFITFAHSLITNPLEYYSCFISYSSHDDVFARGLHADLQKRNIRTWFAPEDLKIGDRFRDRIEDSIRLHDKLILVLSQHSIGSTWVRREVEAAFEREDREKREVLFPIAIDKRIFETNQAWAADIRRTRHIGDFTIDYSAALERLTRDLKRSQPLTSTPTRSR